MTMYNAIHDGDQYRITKFDNDGNVQSSYLCDHVQCQCPAGVRPTCRHRQMLPTFLTEGLVNTNLFLDWDNGRRVVDFDGSPATVQSNEIIEPDLAPQALTDTIDRPVHPLQPHSTTVSASDFDSDDGGSNPPAVATRQTFTIPEGYEAVRDVDGRATGETQPIKPANGWRRF